METVTTLPITESEFYTNMTPTEMQMFVPTYENILETENTAKCEEYIEAPKLLDDEAMEAIEKLFKCMNVTYVIEKTLKSPDTYQNQIRWVTYSYFLELTLSKDKEFTNSRTSAKVVPLFIQIRKENDVVFVLITTGISCIACLIVITVLSKTIRGFCKRIIYSNQYDVENFNRGEFISLNKIN